MELIYQSKRFAYNHMLCYINIIICPLKMHPIFKCRLTPWKSWSEWIQVKDSLFASYAGENWCNYDTYHESNSMFCGSNEPLNSSYSEYWGLEAVSCWKARGKVPHSAEATAQLIEVSNSNHWLIPASRNPTHSITCFIVV